MKILVIRWGTLETLPPARSLIRALSDLGHEVTLVAHHLPNHQIGECGQKETLDIGVYPKVGSSYHHKERMRSLFLLRRIVKKLVNHFDIVWTTSDNSALYIYDLIPVEKHIMQLAELVEYVPYIGSKNFLKANGLVAHARKVRAVVVPESNRAYIQRAYWSLPSMPFVLPNYPYDPPKFSESELPPDIAKQLASEEKKVLYQGVFAPDRDIEPYCRAVEELGDGYEFLLLGESNHYQRELCCKYSHTHYLGYIEPPNHLTVALYAAVGVLPYSAKGQKIGHLSTLNAIYCAPNKIWEYAYAGLPMVANKLPGIDATFSANRIGICVAEGSMPDIVEAITTLVDQGDAYRMRCRAFYASVDYAGAVARIIASSQSKGASNED